MKSFPWLLSIQPEEIELPGVLSSNWGDTQWVTEHRKKTVSDDDKYTLEKKQNGTVEQQELAVSLNLGVRESL